MTDDLVEVCRIAVDEMIKAGADLADAAASRGRSVQAEVRENSIPGTQSHRARSLSLRAIVGRRIGMYDLHSLEKDAVKDAALIAVETARNAEADPDFRDLPHPEPYAEVEGTYDPKAEEMKAASVFETAKANIETARERFDKAVLSGGVALFASHGAIANSNGVEVRESGSFASTDLFCVMRSGEEIGSFFAFSEGRHVEALSDTSVGVRASEKASEFLGAKAAKAGAHRLLLVPLAAYDLLRTVVRAANAESIQRGRSFLCDLIGEEIAPEDLRIADDPLVPLGTYTSKADGEGAPRKRVDIVTNGALSGHLHSSYTANKEGVPNNGHGGRTGGVYATNIRVEHDGPTFEEMLKEVDEAILLLAGSLEPDTVNGKISTLLDFAMKVENGSVAYPLKGGSISADFLEVLEGIERMSRAEEVIPGCVVPAILTGPVEIQGSG